MKRLLLVAVCACLFAIGASASDIIDWGQLGASPRVLDSYQTWTSQSGQYTGTVQNLGGGSLQRVDQGNGWEGNFYNGDHLIWNGGGPYSQEIDIAIFFDQPVVGGGAQIQARYYGEFWASIMAFDSHDNMIGEVDMQGQSNANGDGSALYISFLSNQPNVTHIEFNVYDINGGDSFAIGKFTIAPAVVTPEPGSLVLLGSGLMGALTYVRRRIAQ